MILLEGLQSVHKNGGLDSPGCRGPCAAGNDKQPRRQATGTQQKASKHLGSGLSILLDALGSALDDLGRLVSLGLRLLGHLRSISP